MRKYAIVAGVLLVLVFGSTALTYAQPYWQPYPGPAGERIRIVNGEPAAVCANRQDFRRFLVAYTNGNRYRMRETVSQSCALLPRGARVLVVQRPFPVAVWQGESRQSVDYRVVQVRVLTGPDRGYTGYMLVDMIV